MFHLQNDTLSLAVSAHGAELKSVFHKQTNVQYMWQANPAFWAKTSPVLFPIVGQLKENTYRYNGKTYRLPRHGFARDKEFVVAQHDQDALTFSLRSNAETLAVYPFRFAFSVGYALHHNELTVTYNVQNEGKEEMYFSVGGHPAFKLPLVDGTAYNDYRLVFNKTETAGRWPISKEGLIETTAEPLLSNANVLPLSKALFQNDAVVLKRLQSDAVLLTSEKTPHGLQFSFPGFSFLGLWATPGADFLCIEPWCGLADSTDADGQLAHKEGINKLPPLQTFSVAWQVRFF